MMIKMSHDQGKRTIPCCLYAYWNIVTDKPYFGVTISEKRRAKGHKQNYNDPAYSSRFIRSVRKYGWEAFTYVVIGEYPDEVTARIAEECAIRGIGGMRFCYNQTMGGDGAKSPCDETRAKLSKAKKGVSRGPLTEASKVKISKANKGSKRTPEQNLHQSQIKKGKPRSEKGKLAAVEAGKRRIGTKLTEEHKSNIAKSHIGIKPTPESVEKQRNSLINSEAHKVAVAAMTGVPRSPELVKQFKEIWAIRRANKALPFLLAIFVYKTPGPLPKASPMPNT